MKKLYAILLLFYCNNVISGDTLSQEIQLDDLTAHVLKNIVTKNPDMYDLVIRYPNLLKNINNSSSVKLLQFNGTDLILDGSFLVNGCDGNVLDIYHIIYGFVSSETGLEMVLNAFNNCIEIQSNSENVIQSASVKASREMISNFILNKIVNNLATSNYNVRDIKRIILLIQTFQNTSDSPFSRQDLIDFRNKAWEIEHSLDLSERLYIPRWFAIGS